MASVALVVLDTLRKDAFDKHFRWLPGTTFDNAWSTSHCTPPVHASLFGGKYPSELGVYGEKDVLSCTKPVLAEVLSEAGYRTTAYTANPLVSDYFEFGRGFDEFHRTWNIATLEDDIFDWQSFIDESDEGVGRFPRAFLEVLRSDADSAKSLFHGVKLKLKDLGRGPYADDGATEVLNWLDRTEFADDHFLFVNLMEAHSPYVPPKEYRTGDYPWYPDAIRVSMEDMDVDAEGIRRAYDDSVTYLSDMYRQIFECLRESFDYVITVSDHGELFGSHGMWGHFHGLYPEVTQVPVAVWSGESERRQDKTPISLLDVHQTILSALDVEAESRGSNLLDDIDGRPRLTQCAGISSMQLETITDDAAREEAKRYDEQMTGIVFPDGYYGFETADRFVEEGDTSYEDPRAKMEDLVKSLDSSERTSRTDISETVQSQLEDLGYA